MNSKHQIILRFTGSRLNIAQGTTASLHDARGCTLRTESGCVWITEDGSTTDVCLQAGESFTIARDGSTLVSACRPAAFAVVAIEGRRASAPAMGERMRRWYQAVFAPSSPATPALG